MERTFLMIKPDGVVRGLIGEIISRIEKKGLKIVAIKMLKMTRDMAEKLYEQHKGKSFFNELIDYVTSAPVVAMVIEGREAVNVVRKIIGKTDPIEAEPGSIRFDFGMTIGKNIVHAADSKERAEKEIKIFFKDEEILDYKRADENWLY